MSLSAVIGRGILARQKAESLEREWYAGALAEFVEVCVVCGGPDPVRLSTGFLVHPGCWSKVTWSHVR